MFIPLIILFILRLHLSIWNNRYAYSGRPVVIKDALVEWDATNAFSYAFFQRLYLVDKPVARWRSAQRCQFFPYKTGFRTLREALSMSHNRTKQPWYFGW